MRADLGKLAARASDVRLDLVRSSIVVTLRNGRRHEIRIDPRDDGYLFEAIVAGPRDTARLGDPAMNAWRRNRSSRLVGYRVDRRGRLVAHAWSPREGLTREMFLVLVRTLAREADRHEGSDRR